MSTAYCLSSTRNTITPSQLYLPKYRPPSIVHEAIFPKKEALPLKLHLLRERTLRPAHPFASISSFADAEGEEIFEHGIKLVEHKRAGPSSSDIAHDGDGDSSPGMAQAFGISSRTASAISICIALAALSLPLVMRSLGQGMAMKTRGLSYMTLLFGFYMAWNIGANDVANAMGTSVGSGALTLPQAVLTAAVLEFLGALLMGTHVTSTMQKGILVADVFKGKDTLLFAGLLSSLAAAGTWLQVL